MVKSEFGVNNMKEHLVSIVHAAAVAIWQMFSWDTLDLLVLTDHHLNAVSMSILLRRQSTHLLMDASSRITHLGQIITKVKSSQIGFLNMAMSSSVLRCPPQSPDPNPLEHVWNKLEQNFWIKQS